MCGIYGSTFPYKDNIVKAKLERTKFRGPDAMAWQYYQNENQKIVLGHNRLSIIDLDERSNQPFTYCNNIHIVFNGEIYNFKELKQVLIKKGYQFQTTSDTEVICASYLEYGENCLSYLNGMFAFVIYDEKQQVLFGARDRLGKKPFYYFHNGAHFEFASQLSSIQLFNKNITISSDAIHRYLCWSTVPDPYSIYNEVKKLPSGHYFTYNIQQGDLVIKSYWDIDYHGVKLFNGSYNEAKDELEKLLLDSVKSRLFADVPVGIFLSGGVDSSLIAALATKSTNEKVKTFSVRFDEKGYDESIYAQQVANHIGSEHHIIDCNYKDGIELIENFCYYYDEPFADSSAIPSMLLAKNTRKYVTVALSGDGGDESFIGYHRYNWLNYMNKIYMLPTFIRLFGAKVLRNIPYYKLKIIADVIRNVDVNNAYLSTMGSFNTPWMEHATNPFDFKESKYLFHNSKNVFERASDFDIKTYLNWDINTKVDRATMAYSLEARAPLMDYRVVDFARSLPTNFKYDNKIQKKILKDILYNYVPKEIFERPKAGFTMPFRVWFKNDLKDLVLSELSPTNLKDIPGIKPKEVTEMIEKHMNGAWNHYPLIWKLLVLRQWLSKNGQGISIK